MANADLRTRQLQAKSPRPMKGSTVNSSGMPFHEVTGAEGRLMNRLKVLQPISRRLTRISAAQKVGEFRNARLGGETAS